MHTNIIKRELWVFALTCVRHCPFFFHTATQIQIVDTEQIQTTCKLGIMAIPSPVRLDFLILPSLTHSQMHTETYHSPETLECVKEGITRSFFSCLNLGRAGIHHRSKPVSHQTQKSVANAISLSHCLTWLHVGWGPQGAAWVSLSECVWAYVIYVV